MNFAVKGMPQQGTRCLCRPFQAQIRSLSASGKNVEIRGIPKLILTIFKQSYFPRGCFIISQQQLCLERKDSKASKY